MKYNATKVFNVTYNNVTEPHTCGHVTLDNGQEIGRYSGNIFDGYHCIINTDGHRAYISGATLSHLRRKTWHWLVDNDLTPGQKNRRK